MRSTDNSAFIHSHGHVSAAGVFTMWRDATNNLDFAADHWTSGNNKGFSTGWEAIWPIKLST
jgi:hypothetical protein